MATLVEEYLSPIVTDTFVGTNYEIALINNPTAQFSNESIYANVILNEVTSGFGGYARLTFSYTGAEVLPYENGYPLIKKSAVFVHDGSDDVMQFSHVAIIKEDAGSYELVAIHPIGSVVTLSNGRLFQVDITVNIGGS